jgi:hypothetical protein
MVVIALTTHDVPPSSDDRPSHGRMPQGPQSSRSPRSPIFTAVGCTFRLMIRWLRLLLYTILVASRANAQCNPT